MPKVSVIIPTFNRAALLPRAINSVLVQSFSDWEIIVVDDGSTDNTREVVESFANRGIAIRYIWQENKKQAAARNTGIRNAKGQYLAFLDSDDEWLPYKLERQTKVLEKLPDIAMVYGNQLNVVNESDIGTIRYPIGFLKSGNIFSDLLHRRYYCSTPTIILRKAVIAEVGGFDEHFANALEDWELTLRVAVGHQIHCIDMPLIRRYENATYPKDYAVTRASNHRAILEKIFSRSKLSAHEQNVVWKRAWFGWGVSFLQSGYYRRSIISLLQALRRGHRFAFPALVLASLGPIGRYAYTLILRVKRHQDV